MKKIVWILIIALTLMGCNSDPTKKSSYDERGPKGLDISSGGR